MIQLSSLLHEAHSTTLHEGRSTAKWGIVELFAGAAGLAQGFVRTGHYDLIALSDIDQNAQLTFQANYPQSRYIASDIHELSPKQILDIADGRKIVGVLGGPPCQGFSLAGLKNPDDARNQYITDYVRFVSALDPDFLVMENVPQLLFHKLFVRLLDELKDRYQVRYAILNAALYGVPQTRHRAFVLAYHRRLGITPTFPKPTHSFVDNEFFNYYLKRLEQPNAGAAIGDILGSDPIISKHPELVRVALDYSLQLQPLVTVEDAIGDLRSLQQGEAFTTYPHEAYSVYQQMARANSSELFNHIARKHSKEMMKLIQRIPEGGDLRDVAKRYWPKSHYSQAYGRLHRKGLSRTLTTYFCNPGSGRFIHPQDARAISVREAARLQGFSDQFKFLGNQEQRMSLVGNAVPLPLAQAIGAHIDQECCDTISSCQSHTVGVL
jgi:DNA (cytosine-5)-methyltransferase 1